MQDHSTVVYQGYPLDEMALKDHIMPAPDDYDDRYIWNLPAQCMPTPDDYDHETTCSNTEGTM